jgi:hypothetical protein
VLLQQVCDCVCVCVGGGRGEGCFCFFGFFLGKGWTSWSDVKFFFCVKMSTRRRSVGEREIVGGSNGESN